MDKTIYGFVLKLEIFQYRPLWWPSKDINSGGVRYARGVSIPPSWVYLPTRIPATLCRREQTHTCKHITIPQLRWRAVLLQYSNYSRSTENNFFFLNCQQHKIDISVRIFFLFISLVRHSKV